MSERENILGRIREALRMPAPRPGQGHNDRSADGAAIDPKRFLPPGANGLEERLQLFAARATDLKAYFYRVANQDELRTALARVRQEEQWKAVATHSGTLTDSVCLSLGLPVCRTDSGYEAREMEQCGAGITECDALVAQTGSVLVTARSAGGRALSALPPHHIVLARADQLVSDLPEAFELLKRKYGKNYPSFISFITGPSRTGDIERILVLGAHGPKKLTIFCV